MPKKEKAKEGLYPEQIEFIKKKVVELGTYRAVLDFYKLRDEVTSFAREEARKVYKIDELTDDEDFEEEEETQKKPKAETKTVKRKRKIDVEDVLDGEEE